MPRISANRINVFYRVQGDGEPVVLLHGFTANHGIWEHQIEALSQKFRVLAYDLRGHGDTDQPSSGHDINTLVQDLAELLEKLKIGAAHIAGVSLGGMVAQRFCLDDPRRVKTLMLTDTFAGKISDELQKTLFHHARIGKQEGMEALFEHLLEHPALPLGPDYQITLEELEEKRREFMKNGPDTLDKFVNMMAKIKDWSDELENIDKPALLIVGDQDAPSLSHMREMHRKIQGSEFHVIAECGHVCVSEKPEEISRLMLDFLCRHSGSS